MNVEKKWLTEGRGMALAKASTYRPERRSSHWPIGILPSGRFSGS
ncbi:hypothetical protein QWZ16_21705 [Vibrio ostreicida]|uniref:Uncharacterized protein n=1 Tax=Vibrio ostreicida TaxID=526588 RepID=A0ABT8C0R6_9VIBR|nr:hypothetical protein [Vibrio ostreicida]MDN3612214.1 hypothetical protein [Vibrio ostreicida]